MTKLSISLAITAAVLLSTAACEQKEVKREAKDIEKAEEKVEKKQEELEKSEAELVEKKVELALDVQTALNEAEKRFEKLDARATTVTKTLDTTTGPGAEIQQAHMLAKAKLEAAKKAATTPATPEDLQKAMNEAKDAIDKLEKKLDDYQDAV